jgi:hypothetical protein
MEGEGEAGCHLALKDTLLPLTSMLGMHMQGLSILSGNRFGLLQMNLQFVAFRHIRAIRAQSRCKVVGSVQGGIDRRVRSNRTCRQCGSRTRFETRRKGDVRTMYDEMKLFCEPLALSTPDERPNYCTCDAKTTIIHSWQV